MLPLLLCYIRKSVLKDDQRTSSPERQREAILRVAPPGWELRWYEDLDYSGATSVRPDWQRLLADLQNPALAIGGVAAETLSRLYRNRSEFETLKRLIAARDCELVIATMQGVDGRRASGRLLLNLQADVDQFWSEQSSESMRETIAVLQTTQGRHWGRVPFGCDRDPDTHHLVPSALTYEINGETRYYHDGLAEMFTLYASGQYSALKLARALNAAGWRQWDITRTIPQEWTLESVRGVLRRWALYAGSLPDLRGDRPTLDGGHAPILPVELCEQVGERMRLRAKARGARQENRVYILSGILRCAACGEVMSGQTYRKPYGQEIFYYYRHRYHKHQCQEPMVHAGPLEAEVVEMMRRLEPLLEEVRAAMYLIIEEASRQPDSTAGQLAKKKEELERLIDLAVSGLITRPQFEARRAPLQIEIERLEAAAGAMSPASMQRVELQLDRIAETLHLRDEQDSFALKEIIINLFERLETREGRITGVVPQAWARPLFVYGLDLASLIPICTATATPPADTPAPRGPG